MDAVSHSQITRSRVRPKRLSSYHPARNTPLTSIAFSTTSFTQPTILTYTGSEDDDDDPTPRAYEIEPPDYLFKTKQDFEELYDVTDDEDGEDSQEVPLKCSNSIKATFRQGLSRYPSLVIPPPSAWPTIHNQQKSACSSIPPTPLSAVIPMSPAVLNMFNSLSLQIPPSSATPSLDGSMTSEEALALSCPSTPEVLGPLDGDIEWVQTIQLQPEALDTLHHLGRDASDVADEQAIDMQPIECPQEMQQVPGAPRLITSFDSVVGPVGEDERDLLSPLSVPSPGGFFSSLAGDSRDEWSAEIEPPIPSTSIAEQFYDLPWKTEPEIEKEMHSPAGWTDSTVTVSEQQDPDIRSQSRQDSYFYLEVDDVLEMEPGRFEYNESYEDELIKMASANLDRTTFWLASQSDFVVGDEADIRKQSNHVADDEGDRTSAVDVTTSPSKKSVRFADECPSPFALNDSSPSNYRSDSIFYRAFQHISNSSHAADALFHSKTRSEAVDIGRRCFTQEHCDRLMGRFELVDTVRPSAQRPISSFYTETVKGNSNGVKEQVAVAEKERQALEKLKHSCWNIEAVKFLNGGKLLSSPVVHALEPIKQQPPLCAATYIPLPESKIRVLDLGGQPTCSWAWEMALEYRHSTIYTASLEPPSFSFPLRGPHNHRVVYVTNLWTLPFPDNSFEVISARSLFSQLKQKKKMSLERWGTEVVNEKVEDGDEWDACLRECYRCLRPGGWLDFQVTDAGLLFNGTGAGNHAQNSSIATATSVEFCYNLKILGYDPAPTTNFVGRLIGAGFEGVRRAWVMLPAVHAASSSPSSSSFTITDTSNIKETEVFQQNHQQVVQEKFISPTGDVLPIPPCTPQDPPAGSTSNVSHLTQLIGATAWEKWLLKCQREMGRDEDCLLHGLANVFDEMGNTGGGWSWLVGCARKPDF